MSGPTTNFELGKIQNREYEIQASKNWNLKLVWQSKSNRNKRLVWVLILSNVILLGLLSALASMMLVP